MQMQSKALTIVLSGEYRTGKASICKRFSEKKFEKRMFSTIGIDFVKKWYNIKTIYLELYFGVEKLVASDLLDLHGRTTEIRREYSSCSPQRWAQLNI